MKEFLFSSVENSNRLRLFRLGKEWHECFVVEFMLGKNHYEHLYWGNQIYVEEDRHVISLMLIIAFLPDSRDEWKKENLEKMQMVTDINHILNQVENEISKRTNRV